MAEALEEASLIEGFSAAVYSHLGNVRRFVLRTLTMLPGESGHDF